jgi:gamma-glutamyl:cysteine ligase YbdK (ATP-grasp superfamily)
MGANVDREHFDDGDYQRFAQRLQDSLTALDQLLARPDFGVGPSTVGAELELFLIDSGARPLPLNRIVLGKTVDPRVTLEMDRFNLELNTRPTPLAGDPFAAISAEIDGALGSVRKAAAAHGGRVVAIGILPTLRQEDLTGAITQLPRYRALCAGIQRLKQAPFEVRIDGEDPLNLTWDDVSLEGANTSFQLHLRVNPSDFARIYNAAQLAIGPTLAAAGNSPFFVGHRLWEETRVALCKQATDPRPITQTEWHPTSRVTFGQGWVRQGAAELFRESVALHPPLLPLCGDEEPLEAVVGDGVPRLSELSLHNGTVWSWNRVVYDSADGGHLRVEMRALPAGPSTIDMMANAAFLLGLVLELAPRIDDLLPGMPFEQAEGNFYRAAKHGLGAEILWPTASVPSPQRFSASELLRRLVPDARAGLRAAGVSPDCQRLIDVFEARVVTGRTGAWWQRKTLAALEQSLPRDAAMAALVESYLAQMEGGQPVHQWPDPLPGGRAG